MASAPLTTAKKTSSIGVSSRVIALAGSSYATLHTGSWPYALGWGVLTLAFAVDFLILILGKPDLLKQARENEEYAKVIFKSSQQLMVSIVKSIAGEDREAWGAVVGNMEKSISEYPAEIQEQVLGAGNVMSAVNAVVDEFQGRSSFGLWYNGNKDASMFSQAAGALEGVREQLQIPPGTTSPSEVIKMAKASLTKVNAPTLDTDTTSTSPE